LGQVKYSSVQTETPATIPVIAGVKCSTVLTGVRFKHAPGWGCFMAGLDRGGVELFKKESRSHGLLALNQKSRPGEEAALDTRFPAQ
jgi:hypothetical protein